MGEFDGKVAVVTGSSGIGLGAALKFAREGATVHVCGNAAAHNERAWNEADGLDVTVAEVDVTQPAQLGSWIFDVGSNGGIDVVVNAAAIQTYGTTESTDIDHWNQVIATNLTSCFLTSHFAYPFMKQRGGGAIVHVSSVQGHANQNEVLAYATSKGGIHALTRAQAVDAAKDGIRVNSISPGSVRTPLLEFAAQTVAGEGSPIEEVIEGFGKAHPVGRVGTVEETSELIAFLCSDRAGFCTGGDYLIDGGLTAGIGV
ncbi:MAG: SDR family oxidoreductase [Boseongicola sp. SB0677_bin_26]|nr:SDR family oxidoreductase [Boseongicola sp. SB0665_bin_10]MYG28066.1 SDR family oxidoreductase [Boseongicola sp. SB0677_bin_26]